MKHFVFSLLALCLASTASGQYLALTPKHSFTNAQAAPDGATGLSIEYGIALSSKDSKAGYLAPYLEAYFAGGSAYSKAGVAIGGLFEVIPSLRVDVAARPGIGSSTIYDPWSETRRVVTTPSMSANIGVYYSKGKVFVGPYLEAAQQWNISQGSTSTSQAFTVGVKVGYRIKDIL